MHWGAPHDPHFGSGCQSHLGESANHSVATGSKDNRALLALRKIGKRDRVLYSTLEVLHDPVEALNRFIVESMSVPVSVPVCDSSLKNTSYPVRQRPPMNVGSMHVLFPVLPDEGFPLLAEPHTVLCLQHKPALEHGVNQLSGQVRRSMHAAGYLDDLC